MIARAFGWVDRGVEGALFIVFLLFTLVGGLQVFNRRGAHLGMDMVLMLLPSAAQRGIGLLTEVLWLVLALAIGRYTLVVMQVAHSQESPGLGLPMDQVYAGMVIGSAYLAFVAL